MTESISHSSNSIELPDSTKSRVLIIDDDPFVQSLLRRILERQGYDIKTARRGEEGIAKARELQPALIICDWSLPGVTGLDVCRYIKSDPQLSITFFILLTSRTALADRVEGLEAGADDFLPKPIEVSELRARVRSGVRLYQSFQELKQLAEELQVQKQKLEDELTGAANYLRSLLPGPMTGAITVDSLFQPSSQLGGDCFDYYWLDPDYLAFYLLDVSGHGLSSAMPSVSVHNLLRTQSLPDTNFYQPAAVLRALNETFQMNEQNERYFTIWYGVYNLQKRQLSYASAGHPPAILLSCNKSSSTEVHRLKTRGMPIGMLPNAKYTNGRCLIEPDSTLYIFSDGIYEIEQPDGNMWGLDEFVQLLAKNYASNIDLNQMLQSVSAINQQTIFPDDCSILRVKFN